MCVYRVCLCVYVCTECVCVCVCTECVCVSVCVQSVYVYVWMSWHIPVMLSAGLTSWGGWRRSPGRPSPRVSGAVGTVVRLWSPASSCRCSDEYTNVTTNDIMGSFPSHSLLIKYLVTVGDFQLLPQSSTNNDKKNKYQATDAWHLLLRQLQQHSLTDVWGRGMCTHCPERSTDIVTITTWTTDIVTLFVFLNVARDSSCDVQLSVTPQLDNNSKLVVTRQKPGDLHITFRLPVDYL